MLSERDSIEQSGFGRFVILSIVKHSRYSNEFTFNVLVPDYRGNLSMVIPPAKLIGVDDPRLSSFVGDLLPIE